MTKTVKCPRRIKINRHGPPSHPDRYCALCGCLHSASEISAALAGAYILLIENGKHPDTETVKRLRREFREK